MIEQQVTELESILNVMESAGQPPDEGEIANLTGALSKMFSVDRDEVAILSLNSKTKNLRFVIPEKLAPVGSIPLSSATALAARTARERRPELVNNFSSSRHASVFEGVPMGRSPGELIQKIMSAPILDGTHVRGVVQISRKGQAPADAGPDFTQKDLRALASLGMVLQRFLKLYPIGK
jgi:hypothetical protein